MKTFVNLLPFEYRQRRLVHRRMVQWCVLWGLCVLVVAAACWAKRFHYRSIVRNQEAAERSYLPLAELAVESQKLRKELAELRAKGTVLGQLHDQRPLLSLLALCSRSAEACGGRLVVRSLHFERRSAASGGSTRLAAATPRRNGPRAGERKAAGTAPRDDNAWGVVVVEGEALDNLAVATFVVQLRDSGMFRRVELKSTQGAATATGTVRKYVVECQI